MFINEPKLIWIWILWANNRNLDGYSTVNTYVYIQDSGEEESIMKEKTSELEGKWSNRLWSQGRRIEKWNEDASEPAVYCAENLLHYFFSKLSGSKCECLGEHKSELVFKSIFFSWNKQTVEEKNINPTFFCSSCLLLYYK